MLVVLLCREYINRILYFFIQLSQLCKGKEKKRERNNHARANKAAKFLQEIHATYMTQLNSIRISFFFFFFFPSPKRAFLKYPFEENWIISRHIFSRRVQIYVFKFTHSFDNLESHKGKYSRAKISLFLSFFPTFELAASSSTFLTSSSAFNHPLWAKTQKNLLLLPTIILRPFLSSRNFDNFSFTLFFNPCPPIVKIYSHFQN